MSATLFNRKQKRPIKSVIVEFQIDVSLLIIVVAFLRFHIIVMCFALFPFVFLARFCKEISEKTNTFFMYRPKLIWIKHIHSDIPPSTL